MAQAKDIPDVVEAKPEPAKPAKPLANNRLKLVCASSSDIANRFAALLPSGTPFAAALEPSFWANVAAQLRVGDQIEVHSDGRDFFGRLYIRDVSKTRAEVGRMEFHEFDTLTQSAEPSAFRVKYAGLHSKWSVERVSDGRLMREGCEDQEAAQTALKAMERSMNKVA